MQAEAVFVTGQPATESKHPVWGLDCIGAQPLLVWGQGGAWKEGGSEYGVPSWSPTLLCKNQKNCLSLSKFLPLLIV